MNAPPGLRTTVDWLQSQPQIPFSLQSGVLSVSANGPNGFEILVTSAEGGFDVLCHGWRMYKGVMHDQILSLVCWLVSSSAQLEVEYTAGEATRYTLQTFDGAKWLDSQTVKKPTLGFWKEKTTLVLTNAYV